MFWSKKTTNFFGIQDAIVDVRVCLATAGVFCRMQNAERRTGYMVSGISVSQSWFSSL